jgi:hypothetical protein
VRENPVVSYNVLLNPADSVARGDLRRKIITILADAANVPDGTLVAADALVLNQKAAASLGPEFSATLLTAANEVVD